MKLEFKKISSDGIKQFESLLGLFHNLTMIKNPEEIKIMLNEIESVLAPNENLTILSFGLIILKKVKEFEKSKNLADLIILIENGRNFLPLMIEIQINILSLIDNENKDLANFYYLFNSFLAQLNLVILNKQN